MPIINLNWMKKVEASQLSQHKLFYVAIKDFFSVLMQLQRCFRISELLADIPKSKLSDDIIFGRDDAEHNKNLKATLHKLDESGVKLNRSNCVFGTSKISFYGHNGITPDPKKIE